jgi:hypothetical protein
MVLLMNGGFSERKRRRFCAPPLRSQGTFSSVLDQGAPPKDRAALLQKGISEHFFISILAKQSKQDHIICNRREGWANKS